MNNWRYSSRQGSKTSKKNRQVKNMMSDKNKAMRVAETRQIAADGQSQHDHNEGEGRSQHSNTR